MNKGEFRKLMDKATQKCPNFDVFFEYRMSILKDVKSYPGNACLSNKHKDDLDVFLRYSKDKKTFICSKIDECNIGGDVISYLCLEKNISPIEAVQYIIDNFK